MYGTRSVSLPPTGDRGFFRPGKKSASAFHAPQDEHRFSVMRFSVMRFLARTFSTSSLSLNVFQDFPRQK